MSKLISIIIPSFNRFNSLIHLIQSIKNQTYKNTEIIVINDKSSQPEYYSYDFEGNDIKIIHTEKNSKEIWGFGCPQRNLGMNVAKGEYIAFVDDDDYWMPEKLEIQIKAMEESGYKMSCTDGYFGKGKYNSNEKYIIYNGEKYKNQIFSKLRSKNLGHFIKNGWPKIWTLKMIEGHNSIICSSVIIHKSLYEIEGGFKAMRYGEDYEYWKRLLKHTDLIYIKTPLFYYDGNHGKWAR